jgi:hypothetical protein
MGWEKKSQLWNLVLIDHVKKNHQGKGISGEKRDFVQVARVIVEQAIGEQMDGAPLEVAAPDLRNAKAVARERKGSKTGGRARAAKLTAQERTAIARCTTDTCSSAARGAGALKPTCQNNRHIAVLTELDLGSQAAF